MSYENVPCASPDGHEEPAPSLYGVDEDKIRSVKKTFPASRLAEITNIEDHVIMDEEEIAQVRDSVSTLIGRRDRDVQQDGEIHEGIKHLDDRKDSGSYQRDRWIDLNLPNTTPKRSHPYSNEPRSSNAEVPMNEFADHGTSVIKRAVQDISPDSETQSTRKLSLGGKDDYMNLHCSEKIAVDPTGVRMDRTHAYYYRHEDLKATPPVRDNKDDYDSDTERSSRDLHKNQTDQRAVPQIYYMQHPNSVAMSQASKLGPQTLGVLPAHAHLIHNRFGDNGPIHSGQRAEYANRPEQQVPVANSPGDTTEHNNTRYGGMPAHVKNAAAIHYMDRQGFVPQGFAVLPGIGPVRVVDGVYYTGIPPGHDSTHYESFGAVPTFVPNTQGDVAVIHQQRTAVATSTVASTTVDTSPTHSQDKETINNKPYINQQHTTPTSPTSHIEETKPLDSPPIKNERESPGPTTPDDTDKKSQAARQKGRPKPIPGCKPEIKCEQCGKIFGSSSALAKHKLTHSDERRYVCSICSKGFKRQDHLNGHMVTHRDKKPYECSFQDCDKSYCDMRSLRRHLENHHANGQAVSEGGSRTSSPAPITAEQSGSSCSTPVGESAPGRVVIKPGRGRPPKDRSIKIESHESTDCESGKNSGTSTPGSTHEVVVVQDQATMVSSREHNSDSFSSTGSEEVVHVQVDKAAELKQAGEDNIPHTAIDLLKQAAERAQEQRDKQNVERFPQQQYVMYPDGSISQYPQWYLNQTSVFASQDPRFNAVYQYPQILAQQMYHHGTPQMIVNNPNMQRHPMAARIYTDVNDTHPDKAKQQGVVTPNQVTQRSPSIEYVPVSSGSFMRQAVQQVAGTPTDPTSIALATAKDNGQQLFTREGHYGVVHPSGTQWQQVQYDEPSNKYNNSENALPTMGNSIKTTLSHVRSPSNSSTSSDIDADNNEHYQRGLHYAPGVRHEGFDTMSRKPSHPVDNTYVKKDSSFHHVPQGSSPANENKALNDKEKAAARDDGIFRNPGEIVTPRRKPKPEPLKIPASVSTAYHTTHPIPGSPPYTPPPMLSPRSFYSHVNASGSLTPRSSLPQLPMTPSRLLLSSRSCRTSIDGEEETVVFPEPKINIGPQFQAKIPDRVLRKEFAKNDVHKATMCWSPIDERKKGRPGEIEAFLEMSASCAILGGSSNKEYALHILRRTKGNIKDAVKLILCKKYVTVPSDPMYDYHYEGSMKWSARERQTFRNAFRVKNKNFNDLQKEIGTKTVANCVEFYYLWKANNPEAVRGRTRYVDSDSEEEYEDDTSSETNSNPSLFECDFPQCSAKFVSRQALNGHIRVHGGSFMKPSEPRKRRNPATTSNQDSEAPVVVKRPRKPYVPAPMPQPLVEGGPLPEYACKVCGRIFHKIKSRSAHMKTHVKRPDDDSKHIMNH